MNDFLTWWQHLPENIDPVIFQVGGFRLQYYGLMYLVAFATAYFLAVYRLKKEDFRNFTIDHLQGLMTAIIVGLLIGARLGYVLFYNPSYYASNPLEIFLPFEFRGGFRFTGIAGMSYHGGLIGGFIALLYYARKYRLGVRNSVDLLTPGGAAGYTFGRLGNFINGELWGRATTSPIGMYFPDAGSDILRHPSQLYEAFGEGILLFVLLWSIRHRVKTPGALFAFYLMGYGTVRFAIEFYREPDLHLGFIFYWLTMGQILSLVMISAGIILYLFFRHQAAPRALR
jgi:phosphatidylglycerol---prolipoprotein diacylglyceryl transferase